MKKLTTFLFSILLIVPMAVGATFLNLKNAEPTLNGGGGDSLIASPETEFEEKEEYVVTYKTFDDYFADFNITAQTITEEDLTGNGTAASPYIVKSTRGFLWLAGYDYSQKALGSKYLKLDCDIILNEETFDDNGNPTGGDGVVYSWNSINFGHIRLDGDFNVIKGLFQKQGLTENRRFGLLGYGHIQNTIKNISFENVFVDGGTESAVYCVAWDCKTMINCDLLSGKIQGKSTIAAIAYKATDISFCNNYATVVANTVNVAGLLDIIAGCMYRCNNYGDIYSLQNIATTTVSRCGGLVFEMAHVNSVVSFSNNYGKVDGAGYYIGGIVSFLKKGRIENCNNYGEIKSNLGAMGGIVATGYGLDVPAVITNCSNYGVINSLKNYIWCGEIVGFCGDDYKSSGKIPLTIVSCRGLSKSPCGLVGRLFERVVISDCELKKEFPTNRHNYAGLIVGIMSRKGSVEASNISIQIYSAELVRLRFVYTSEAGNKMCIKNVRYQLTCKSTGVTDEVAFEGEAQIDGLVSCIKTNTGMTKNYFGNDFSGLYVDHKTGEIGVSALSGKGFNRGTVTEEWLTSKGYQKRG